MDRRKRMDLARRFSREARSRYGSIIKDVILYGSVSRDEDMEGSDIDLLVVIDDDNTDIQRDLSFLSFDIGFPEGENISIQTVTFSHFEEYRDFGFFNNIEREGINLG